MKKDRASRRSFLSKLLGGALLAGAGAVIGSMFAYLLPPHGLSSPLGRRQVKIGKAADLPPGKGKLVLVAGEPVWVIHLPLDVSTLERVLHDDGSGGRDGCTATGGVISDVICRPPRRVVCTP